MGDLYADALGFLASASPTALVLALFLENLVILLLAVATGHLVSRLFAHRRITPKARPLEARELAYVGSTLVLNTVVTVIGLYLWRAGIVRFRTDTGLRAWLDVVVLLAVMDLAMYVLHRVAHIPALYKRIHAAHHLYENPRPLTLFVLSPMETLGFGGLWLLLITIYPSSWLGMSIYLALNVAFGTIGHLGVEPLPAKWQNAPVLRWLGTSSFHAGHHQDERHNFGFYTALWDKVFGTLEKR